MKNKFIMTVICLGILAGFWAVAQVPVAPRPLSAWMPRGALLYMQSPDFGELLRDWKRSDVKVKWLTSKNHEEFLTTRLVLKFKGVYSEFANAAGFSPDLDELETVAGTQTALALYDIGRLDFLYISRLPAAQIGQNVFTRVRSGYQSRNAAGQSYFVHQAGERTSAFAAAGDYLVVSTREDLLSSALELVATNNAQSIDQEPWYQDAIRAITPDAAGPFALRLIMDVPNVIKTPYFRSYWIQRNTDQFRNYYAVVSQVNRRGNALEETRALIRSAEAQVVPHESATLDLLRHVPDEAGLFRLWDTTSVDFAMDLIRQKFFAAQPISLDRRRYAPVASFDGVVGYERDLQTRIDDAPKPSLEGTLDLAPLRTLLETAGLEAVLHLESSVPVADGTFVHTDAAVGLRTASRWNAAEIRSALTSAVASYQTVGNVGLQWRDVVSGGYTLSQWDGLLALTMCVDGETLWIARTPSLLSAALNHAGVPPLQPGTYLARYVHKTELPPYLKLMRMLDLSDQANYSGFFSDNVGSLASALAGIDTVSVVISDTASSQRQVVRYELAR
jgi:hypothetical protein